MLVALISSEANLAKADHYRDISKRLAYVRGVSPEAARRAGARGQGRRVDRQRAARQRSGHRAARVPAGASRRHGRIGGDARDPRQRHPGPAADGEPGRHEHGRRLVSEAPEDAPPGQPDAVALPEVHRPRQQPRRVHADAGRDPRRQHAAVQGVAAADHVQPAPGGMAAAADVRAAVSRSVQSEHRPAGHPRHRPGGRRDARPVRARAQTGRGLALPVLHLVQRVHPDHGVLPQHHRHPDRDLAPVGDPVHLRSEALSRGSSTTACR